MGNREEMGETAAERREVMDNFKLSYNYRFGMFTFNNKNRTKENVYDT